MKTILLWALLAVICVAQVSCKKEKIQDTGIIKEEDRTFGSTFTGIDNNGEFSVMIVPANEQKIHIKADAAIYRILKPEVISNRLLLHYTDDRKLYKHSPVEITVYVTTLTEMSVAGSGNITNRDTLFGQLPVSATIGGSGSMELLLKCPAVVAGISGSGNIKLHGKTDHATHYISGSGNIDAYDLQAINVKAVISGNGTICVMPLLTLDATISGSGNIYYKGNAALSVNISGSGKVVKE